MCDGNFPSPSRNQVLYLHFLTQFIDCHRFSLGEWSLSSMGPPAPPFSIFGVADLSPLLLHSHLRDLFDIFISLLLNFSRFSTSEVSIFPPSRSPFDAVRQIQSQIDEILLFGKSLYHWCKSSQSLLYPSLNESFRAVTAQLCDGPLQVRSRGARQHSHHSRHISVRQRRLR